MPATEYDIVICGAGSSGSVLARRLSEDAALQVLLIEAGASDLVPSVQEAARWPENLGSATDWSFMAEPAPHLNGRSVFLSMGKTLGGGSSTNVMVWARGHRADWDYFAEESGDAGWGYKAVLDIYRRIEDWRGKPDSRRGTGGLLKVTRSADPHPAALAMLASAASVGIPSFENPNGLMMEEGDGCALADVRADDGKRLSVFSSYVRPVIDRPNLTVLTETLVDRVVFQGKRAIAVEVLYRGERMRIGARKQIVLSAGAINTPAILMRSGVGDEAGIGRFDIPVVHHLPGVGRNLQDHTCFPVVWEYREPLAPRNNLFEAVLFARSNDSLAAPDMILGQAQFPAASPEAAAGGALPAHGWTMVAGLAQPKSRGSVHLRGVDPTLPPRIELNVLLHPDDWRVARRAIALSREIGATAAFATINAREALPGKVNDADMDNYIRNSAASYFHMSCTAKMGRDAMSVVDAKLKVHGLEQLMIADASIMPRITRGNTMAPCIVIGERAADMLEAELGSGR